MGAPRVGSGKNFQRGKRVVQVVRQLLRPNVRFPLMAIFTAIRRASYFVSKLVAERRPLILGNRRGRIFGMLSEPWQHPALAQLNMIAEYRTHADKCRELANSAATPVDEKILE
jgi:hypothetical protein